MRERKGREGKGGREIVKERGRETNKERERDGVREREREDRVRGPESE